MSERGEVYENGGGKAKKRPRKRLDKNSMLFTNNLHDNMKIWSALRVAKTWVVPVGIVVPGHI